MEQKEIIVKGIRYLERGNVLIENEPLKGNIKNHVENDLKNLLDVLLILNT